MNKFNKISVGTIFVEKQNNCVILCLYDATNRSNIIQVWRTFQMFKKKLTLTYGGFGDKSFKDNIVLSV